jgi:hypothetical protein
MTRPLVHSCALCTTRPADMPKAHRQQLCRCGFELQFHGYGPPHPMAGVGCAGFQAAPPRRPSVGTEERQLSLLDNTGTH